MTDFLNNAYKVGAVLGVNLSLAYVFITIIEAIILLTIAIVKGKTDKLRPYIITFVVMFAIQCIAYGISLQGETYSVFIALFLLVPNRINDMNMVISKLFED